MIKFSTYKIIDMILPPRCPITGDAVDLEGTVSPEAWRKLAFISAPYCDCCGFPFVFAQSGEVADMLCAACLKDRPDYTSARAAIAYDDASRDFILGFKHGDQTQSVVAMVPWLKQAGGDLWERADVILPVPLHRWRLLRRRYNQSGLIAKIMARETGRLYLPDALIRVRATPTQGHLRAKARQDNVRKAFAIGKNAGEKLRGKNIILIDDVYTTGATVRECAKVLKKAGAASVHVITLARVVRPASE